MFFDSVVHEDRNVLDLMTADYTFVNERLAKHYGIPGVFGSYFRRVRVADESRRGLLGKGAVLMVTSHATTTSPVLRGKWVLDNLLGAPPPPPPPDVPALAESETRRGAEDDAASRWSSTASTRSAPVATSRWIRSGSRSRTSTSIGAWRTANVGGFALDTADVLRGRHAASTAWTACARRC